MTNGLKIIAAAGLRPLAEHLIGELARREDPFETWHVVVPHRDVQQWLRQLIAEELGVCMNVEMEPLRRTLDRFAIAATDDAQFIPEAWDALRLQRALLAAIEHASLHDAATWAGIEPLLSPSAPTPDGRARRAPLPLSSAARSRRRMDLASQLAHLFLGYDDTEPAVLDAWERGEEPTGHRAAPWQAALWRFVVVGAGDRVCRPSDRVRLVVDRGRPPAGRTLVFGFAWLAPLERTTLAGLAELAPITCYVDSVAEREAFASSTDSPLARWGAPARETLDSLLTISGRSAVEPTWLSAAGRAPPGGSALARLRSAVATPCDEVPVVDDDDDTLWLLGAPGERRQAEVLVNEVWDDLLGQRGAKDPRRLNDVAVWSAAYEAQISWIEDRFAAIGQLLHSAPHGGRASRLIDVAVELLHLAESGAARSAVLNVVTHANFAGASEAGDEGPGLDRGRTSAELTKLAGIYLGVDEHDPELRYLDGAQRFHWAQGLARLHLGSYVAQSPSDETAATSNPAERNAPAPVVVPAAVDQLRDEARRLEAWVSSLLADIRGLSDDDLRLSGHQWAEVFESLFRTYLKPRGETDAVHFWALLGAARALETVDGVVGEGAAHLDYAAAVELLRSTLGTHGGARGRFRTRGVVVGRLVHNRAVPFRTVCLAGLDEGAVPVAPVRHPLDVRQREGVEPPVSLRELQQLGFLQAILSATDRLILTWTSYDPARDAARSPSSLVAELQEVFPAPRLTKSSIIAQPLTSWSDRYFSMEDGRPSSTRRACHDGEAASRWDAAMLQRAASEAVASADDGAAYAPALSTWTGERARPELVARVGLQLAGERPLPQSSAEDDDGGLDVQRLSMWDVANLLSCQVEAAAETSWRMKGWSLDADSEAAAEHEPFAVDAYERWVQWTQPVIYELLHRSPRKKPTKEAISRACMELLECGQAACSLPSRPFLAPDFRREVKERVLKFMGDLDDIGAFQAGYVGIPVLGQSSKATPGRLLLPSPRIPTSAGLAELTLEWGGLFGDRGAKRGLLTFKGGNADPSVSDSAFRHRIAALFLLLAGELEERTTVRCVHSVLRGTKTFTLALPSLVEAEAWVDACVAARAADPAFFCPASALHGVGLLSFVRVLDDGDADARRRKHETLVDRLRRDWPDRTDINRRSRQSALRDREGFRPPTEDELFDLIRDRYALPVRMLQGAS